MGETKITLPESAIPARWYNIAADMPNRPQPVLHPGTEEPVGPDDLASLFPLELILQEVSGEAEIAIRGHLEDFELPEDDIARPLTAIEPLPKPAQVS